MKWTLSILLCLTGASAFGQQFIPAPATATAGPTLSSLVVNTDDYLVATLSDGSTKTSMQKVAPTLAAVATSGSFTDLANVPGYALSTDARFTLASTALQPAAIGTTVQGFNANTTTLGNSFGTTAGTFAQGNDSRLILATTAVQPAALTAAINAVTPASIGAATAAQGAKADAAGAINGLIASNGAGVFSLATTSQIRSLLSAGTGVLDLSGFTLTLPNVLITKINTPYIHFSGGPITLSTGSSIVDTIVADRPMTITGYKYVVKTQVGTSLSMTLVLQVNGATVSSSSSATITTTATSGIVTLSTPVTLNAGDVLDISRSTTLAVAAVSGPTSGYISATFN